MARLQQVRADAGDDRQQIGDVGRLRDDLRRHERRLQPDQGSLQDAGVPPLPPAQPLAAARRARAGRARWCPERRHRRSRRARSCARARRTRIRCRPTRRSTTFWSVWWSRRCASPTSSPAAIRSRPVKNDRAAAVSCGIQAPAGGAGREGDQEKLWPRPPLPHRQPLPRLRRERARVAGPDHRAAAERWRARSGSRSRPRRHSAAALQNEKGRLKGGLSIVVTAVRRDHEAPLTRGCAPLEQRVQVPETDDRGVRQ